MNNEEKAKELMAKINFLLGTFIEIVKDNVEEETCLIKEWDTYIEKMIRFFIKEIGNVMIPSDTRLQFEEQQNALEIILPKRKIGRDAVPFEEALIRARINAKPFDDDTKRRLVLPKIMKIYLKYLEDSKNK